MTDRQFTEVDLRRMLEHAKGHRADIEEGRWVIDVSHKRAAWEVIVEPDTTTQLLVVVTAYPVEELKS
jgi:hypothetical protein